jgi:hypothetical protein
MPKNWLIGVSRSAGLSGLEEKSADKNAVDVYEI